MAVRWRGERWHLAKPPPVTPVPRALPVAVIGSDRARWAVLPVQPLCAAGCHPWCGVALTIPSSAVSRIVPLRPQQGIPGVVDANAVDHQQSARDPFLLESNLCKHRA